MISTCFIETELGCNVGKRKEGDDEERLGTAASGRTSEEENGARAGACSH